MTWPERGLVALFALNLALLVVGGNSPPYDLRGADYPYPIGSILLTATLMALELAVLWGMLRPRSYRRSRGRALGATAVFGAWMIPSSVVVMHAAGFVVGHALWTIELALISLTTLVLTVGSMALRGATPT